MRLIPPWASWASWLLLDQGLYSVSNLALNLLLARWMQPGEYGAFVVGFGVFLCLGTLHTAFLAEPMMVYGRGRYRHRLGRYLETVARLHWRLAGLGGATIAAVAAVLMITGVTGRVGSSVLAFGLAAPAVLFSWLTRRMCQVTMIPREAVVGSAVYFTTVLAGAQVLQLRGWLSGVSVAGLMGIASLVAGVWLAGRLRVPWFGGRTSILDPKVARRHARYGRWAAGSGILEWLLANAYYFLAPLKGGLEASGTLRALVNLVAPVWLANGAVAFGLVPRLSEVDRDRTLGRLLRNGLVGLGAASLLYLVPVVWFREQLVEWLYSGRYLGSITLVWPLAVFGLVTAAVAMMLAALRALGRPQLVFRSYLVSAILSILLAPVWLTRGGVEGAVYGFAVAWVTVAVMLLVALRRAGLGSRASSQLIDAGRFGDA